MPEHDEIPEEVEEAPSDKRKSASTLLVELAQAQFEFGVSDAGETFAVPRSGPKVVSMLRGGKTSLRRLLARQYFDLTGKAAPQQALADALLVVEGLAQDEDESTLHLRVAEHNGAHWLDLGDHSGSAVRVTEKGWTVEKQAPVLFRRSALNSSLPEPITGGDLDELWTWLNVTKDDRPLILAWLIAAMFPEIPHPILSISGEQGSGKTTAQKVLVSLIDPSPVPTRKPPRDADSWVTAAAGSWVVGLDNLSQVNEWLSDSLCRAVTGDGDVRRMMYADRDLIVFSFRRCIILTGIDLGAVNGDLSDRLLPIHLDIIPGHERLEESSMWPRWTQAHPRLLGALLAGMAGVLTLRPSVRLETKPRMADFAVVLAAVDELLGTDGLSCYLKTQNSIASESLTGDQFLMIMEQVLSNQFVGSSADLLALVTAPDRIPKDWPANARSLTQRLNRQAPVMRRAGWTVENDGGANKAGVVRWSICPPTEKVRIAPLLDPPDPFGREAGMAGHEYGTSQDDDSLLHEAVV